VDVAAFFSARMATRLKGKLRKANNWYIEFVAGFFYYLTIQKGLAR
jgi:hypothetical protein